MTLANRGMLFSHKVVRVRKNPVEVDAMQWSGSLTSADQIIAWAIENGVGPGMRYVRLGNTIDIPSLENVVSASPGDWIIKGVEGEFYPCKPSIFEKTYELVGERYPS